MTNVGLLFPGVNWGDSVVPHVSRRHRAAPCTTLPVILPAIPERIRGTGITKTSLHIASLVVKLGVDALGLCYPDHRISNAVAAFSAVGGS
jgi:hypothetical protein